MSKARGAIEVRDKGLKPNAISFASNIVIGVASAAPAYSLASALGTIAGLVAFGAPAILLAAFVPMLCVAAACYHLNRTQPDCGTTFSWVSHAMGPYAGWISGWAMIVTNIIVMPSLAVIAGQYTAQLFGITEPSTALVAAIGVAWIAAMTAICYRGIELSARTQRVLLGAEFVVLVLFAVLALAKVYGGHAPAAASPVSGGWFNPLAAGTADAFTQALLVAVFIYWGWDTGLTVNEETEDPASGPGKAALISNLLLVGVYLLVAVAALAFAGPDVLARNSADVFAPLGRQVLGPGLDKLLILAVLTSASASTLTSILPAARTALSMANAGAIPARFAGMHPRFMTPGYATLVMGAVSMAWFVGLTLLSKNVLDDSILALGLCIAFYYAMTAFACVMLHWPILFQSVRNFVFIGVLPMTGGLMMAALFVLSCVSLARTGATTLLGIGGPLVIGLGALVLGFVLMLLARRQSATFFGAGERMTV